MITIQNISTKHRVEDYPYGRKKATVFFSIEFSKTKGFRSVFQSINPKNNRLNNPKKSAYSDFVHNYKNMENGHVETGYHDIMNHEDINDTCSFIAAHFDEFQLSPEMIIYIYDRCLTVLQAIQMNSRGNSQLEALTQSTTTLFTHGINTGENILDQIYLDLNAIDEVRKNWPI